MLDWEAGPADLKGNELTLNITVRVEDETENDDEIAKVDKWKKHLHRGYDRGYIHPENWTPTGTRPLQVTFSIVVGLFGPNNDQIGRAHV